MTTPNRRIFAPCVFALAIFAGCQNTKKGQEEHVTTAPASKPTPETKAAKTAMSSEEESMPISSPSSEYTADLLRDMEKGLRRLQSLPSGEPSSSHDRLD